MLRLFQVELFFLDIFGAEEESCNLADGQKEDHDAHWIEVWRAYIEGGVEALGNGHAINNVVGDQGGDETDEHIDDQVSHNTCR